ncbi:hypothetical protein J6590_097763 [Homalodisca vitripennis]|nr:hypothetical protein J6590_097763 [Homalodisca vitripennis]
MVTSLPHRYDLQSCLPINQHILQVNAYVEELCERYPCHFTKHGMQLTFHGKKALARLLLTCTQSVGLNKSTQTSRSLPPELDMLNPSRASLLTPPAPTSKHHHDNNRPIL